MKQLSILLITIFTINLCNIQVAQAHSGGTDSSGCHNDNINGGRHCHNDGDDDSGGSLEVGDALLWLTIGIIIGYIICKAHDENYFSNDDAPDEDRIQPYLHLYNDGIDNQVETGI
ncbi:MAG: YHYH domain-containing protein [Alphaproteobacteria bacterium]|nr:YHYH domain-containing protein [Alphaproteobacteria bacterium]